MNKNTMDRIQAAIELRNVAYDEYSEIKKVLDKSRLTLKEKCNS